MGVTIPTQCPYCGKIANVPSEMEGRRAQCRCGEEFEIVDATDSEMYRRHEAANEALIDAVEVIKSKQGEWAGPARTLGG